MNRIYYSRPLGERLSAKLSIDPATGCHNWTGGVAAGYGRIFVDAPGRRTTGAHRLAYELANGPIPDEMVIDHLCRNRLCCNPNHLEAVTPAENNYRSSSPSALNAGKTHCKHGHEFTPENTYRPPGIGGRRCRTCDSARLKDNARARIRRAGSTLINVGKEEGSAVAGVPSSQEGSDTQDQHFAGKED